MSLNAKVFDIEILGITWALSMDLELLMSLSLTSWYVDVERV